MLTLERCVKKYKRTKNIEIEIILCEIKKLIVKMSISIVRIKTSLHSMVCVKIRRDVSITKLCIIMFFFLSYFLYSTFSWATHDVNCEQILKISFAFRIGIWNVFSLPYRKSCFHHFWFDVLMCEYFYFSCIFCCIIMNKRKMVKKHITCKVVLEIRSKLYTQPMIAILLTGTIKLLY